MPRLDPLPPETTPDLARTFAFFNGTLGFVPNSMLIMQRVPRLVEAFVGLNAAVMSPEGTVDPGFRRLIGHVCSKAAGCSYCMAHTVLGGHNFGISDEKLADLWSYETSPHYSEKERAALDFAQAAGQVPNAVADADFDRLKRYWSEAEIVEILAVIAMFGFLNRWNDSLATPLENPASDIAAAHVGKDGWSVGKHAR